MSNETKMKKVRIDESLLEQIDWYDMFPKGMWSRQAKANYLIQIGLAVLLVKFEQQCKEQQCKEQQPDGKEGDLVQQIVRNQAVERLIQRAAETKIPRSELARLVNRSLYE